MRRSRRHEDGHSESSDRWLVSYADFITLLFAFFVVLYATSERNSEKTEQFEESVKKYLIKAAAFGGGGAGVGEKIGQGDKFNTPIEPPIQTYKQGDEKSVETQNLLETFVDENLRDEQKHGLILDIASDELGVRISLSSPAVFAAASTQFQPTIVKALARLGQFVASLNKRVLVEGHDSADEPRGPQFASPWEFAAARATAFVRYLAKVHHVPAENLVALSRGAERPFVPAGSPGARAKNNRLEIVILSDDSPL